jgi:hypothetical protein
LGQRLVIDSPNGIDETFFAAIQGYGAGVLVELVGRAGVEPATIYGNV